MLDWKSSSEEEIFRLCLLLILWIFQCCQISGFFYFDVPKSIFFFFPLVNWDMSAIFQWLCQTHGHRGILICYIYISCQKQTNKNSQVVEVAEADHYLYSCRENIPSNFIKTFGLLHLLKIVISVSDLFYTHLVKDISRSSVQRKYINNKLYALACHMR